MPSGGGSAPITPPKVVVPKVKNAQEAAEDAEFDKYSAINWKDLDDVELYKNVVDLSKYLGTGVRQDKFYPLFIGLFKVYADKLGTAFARFKDQINSAVQTEKYRQAENSGWRAPTANMRIIGFSGAKYEPMILDTGNETVIPLILRVLAEYFPDLQLFGLDGELKTTAFQQLLMFESADPTTARLKKEMVSQLLDGKTQAFDGNTLLARLQLDKVGNAPWPFVKSKQAFDELVAKVPLNDSVLCKLSQVGDGNDFALNVLDCALMVKAPLDVIQELIKDKGMLNKLSMWRGIDTYPIILAAEYSDLETFKLINEKTSISNFKDLRFIDDEKNFASLRHENLDNARYLLNKNTSSFVNTLSDGKGTLVGLLSNDKYFAATNPNLAGNQEFVKVLLDKGVPVKAYNGSGFMNFKPLGNESWMTPIAWAAKKGDEWLFKLFVEKAQKEPAKEAAEIINEFSREPRETALQQLTKELLVDNFLNAKAKETTREMTKLLINAGAELSGPKANIEVDRGLAFTNKVSWTLLAALAQKPERELVSEIITKASNAGQLEAVVNASSGIDKNNALYLVLEKMTFMISEETKKEYEKVAHILIAAGVKVLEPISDQVKIIHAAVQESYKKLHTP